MKEKGGWEIQEIPYFHVKFSHTNKRKRKAIERERERECVCAL